MSDPDAEARGRGWTIGFKIIGKMSIRVKRDIQ
jgi:hypothetical protein